MISITSAEVGMKINEWHRHIQKFNVTDAEMLKAEIERDIEVMEEDQDLLIYHQLMAFRHKIMLEYTLPSDENRMEFSEYLKKIEGYKKKLDNMRAYYYNFFRGMYEFRNGKYTKAITYYKKAERKIPTISDKIEKAEFYFKLSEVYYHMKMTLNFHTISIKNMNFILFGVFSAILSLPATTMTLKTMKKLSPTLL